MHFIQLLLFCATITHGLTTRDFASLYDCLSGCSNDTCLEDCNEVPDMPSYPQVNEDTLAGIDLHCVGENMMMLKFNPGIYIIEQSSSETAWSFVKVTKLSLATFTNLTAGTTYRYRFYNVTSQGIARPDTSKWFTTYEADYEPLPVKNVSLLSLTADRRNIYNLRAEIGFEPAQDRNCNYDVLVWNGAHTLWNFYFEKMTEFRFNIHRLEFSETMNVSIFSVNGHDILTGSMTSMTFDVLSCLEYYHNNLTICAPESVKGLEAEHTYRDGELYDVKVHWNKSSLEPDNYTIGLDLYEDSEDILTTTVPGNTTEAFFSRLKLGPQYAVSIVAESLGGISTPITVLKSRTTEAARPVNEFYRDIVIGTSLSITIVVLVVLTFAQYYKQKNKRFAMECARFENSNEKEQFIEITKKLLPQNHEFKISNPISMTLTHDKFQLDPKLLKIKSVLGSGAYGVVKLGVLLDKFDNVTDVAVKMLKDNPTMDDMQNFHKEILIMKFVGPHPNIVSLIGCCDLNNKPVLVVEYCCKGDLQRYLRTIWQNMLSVAFNHKARFKFNAEPFGVNDIGYTPNNSGGKEHNCQNNRIVINRLYDVQEDISQCTEVLTPGDLLNFARQIATGMEFLSSNRIVHRDLAARNILVCADRIVKISDFGLSRDVYQENLYREEGNNKLPLKWMAIEALTHQIYTSHSDVWSFGILLWEIVTMGGIPYPEISTSSVLKLLKSGYRLERPPCCSKELYYIMFSCWHIRPQSRPTFTQLKESLDNLLSHHSNNEYLDLTEMYRTEEEHRDPEV